jgi:hypothetical protein
VGGLCPLTSRMNHNLTHMLFNAARANRVCPLNTL